MLKQQLQKTNEEFNEKYFVNSGVLPVEDFVELEQFIRQEQIDAVKAFAEDLKEILEVEKDEDPDGGHTCHYDSCYDCASNHEWNYTIEEIVDKINNLLKDI